MVLEKNIDGLLYNNKVLYKLKMLAFCAAASVGKLCLKKNCEA
mgnify:CR=1 FL=1